jgi:type IV secretory pathway TrbD component
MTATIYPINRAINRPITFHGLKAQYIVYAGALIAGDLVFFVILFVAGVNNWICITISFGLGAFGVIRFYRLSLKYGEFGIARKKAARLMPHTIRFTSRNTFIHLNKNNEKLTGSLAPHPRNQQ